MGFNKRIVTRQSLLGAYNRDGITGVERLFDGADALFFSGDSRELISKIYESLRHLDQEKTYKLINELINE